MLVLTLCLAAPAFAQGRDVLKPAWKAMQKETAARELSRQRIQKQLVNPLRPTERLQLLTRSFTQTRRTTPSTFANKISAAIAKQYPLLAVHSKPAMIAYGKRLMESGEFNFLSEPWQSQVNAIFNNHESMAGGRQPFQSYVTALGKITSARKWNRLPLKQRAVMLFLLDDLQKTTDNLYKALDYPDYWAEATHLSFTAARDIIRLTQLMAQSPKTFSAQLFELSTLLDAAPKTPFTEFLQKQLIKSPDYAKYCAWIRAEKTGINPVSFEEMYRRFSAR